MLQLQRPGSGHNLLAQLTEVSARATSGGGIFAWATVSGVRTLFAAKEFVGLLQRGTFALVIGMDSITDEAAVRELRAMVAAHPGLSVRVLSNQTRSVFHPKLSWFEVGDDLEAIVGSGNLTGGGLRANWEAFLHQRLVGQEAVDARAQIATWLTDYESVLFDISDRRVLDRVARNVGDEALLKRDKSTPSPIAAPKPRRLSAAPRAIALLLRRVLGAFRQR